MLNQISIEHNANFLIKEKCKIYATFGDHIISFSNMMYNSDAETLYNNNIENFESIWYNCYNFYKQPIIR